MSENPNTSRFNILCLDGGGAKGFYTLGFGPNVPPADGARNRALFFNALLDTNTIRDTKTVNCRQIALLRDTS
jgi:hypothetical protein